MANVGGVSSSNANSLYGNRNVISGLASGMDTESMIKNSVSGIEARITSLVQKQTKVGWRQEAYRSIIDKMVSFTRKYTSYTSSTNLLSPSFFNKAVTTTTSGANASKVSATGRGSSSAQINGVAQLASASRYQINGGGILDTITDNTNSAGQRYVQGGSAMDLGKETYTSNLSGNLTLQYGGEKVTLNFDDTTYKTPEEFKAAIEAKLADEDIVFDSGTTMKANEAIKVEIDTDGKITFSDKIGSNSVGVVALSGKLNTTMGNPTFDPDAPTTTLDMKDKDLYKTTTVLDKIGDTSISFNLDGITKKIKLPTKDEISAAITAAAGTGKSDEQVVVGMINDKLKDVFGSGKVEAGFGSGGELRFTALGKGSNLSVIADSAEALGLRTQETTYLNTGRTMGDFFGTMPDGSMPGIPGGTLLKGEGDPIKQKDGSFLDKKGQKVDKDGYLLGKDGKPLTGYSLTINGKTIGNYTRDTAMDTIVLDINKNTEAGVNLTYSRASNQFVFSATETGSGRDISVGGGLGSALFGDGSKAKMTQGTDAIVHMTVNGSDMTVTRSSNTFDVDGLSVTVGGTFNGKVDTTTGSATFDFLDASGNVDKNLLKDPVSFTTKSDADKIVTAISDLVKDYNEMVKELREAYATMPAEKSKGVRYEPLIDSDLEGMSESAIEAYEEKAKQGIVFGDADLTALYSKLTTALSPSGADGGVLREMGLGTKYSQGLTTLDLDESKLRKMLETDPDAVSDAFTKVAGEGSATSGLMTKLKASLDTYGSVDGRKGVLVNKAGSKYSPSSLMDNDLQTQVDDYDTQIEKWQTKLSEKVDYYTRQYSRLEQLIAQMNSQSSSIMSMMGGGAG